MSVSKPHPIPKSITDQIRCLEVGGTDFIEATAIVSWRSIAQRQKGRKFVTRREGDGYRVWRTK